MKPKPPTPELNRQILDEASEWFVDFRVGDVDTAARERFDDWLRRSPEHIRAYWEIAKTYVELPQAPGPGKLDVGALIAYARSDANVVPLPSRTHEIHALHLGASRGPLDEGRAGRLSPRFRRPFFAAASIAFALVIAAAVYWEAHRYPIYATDIGERRSITLADGSTVDLNARSKLRVEFSDHARRVELLDGQALFEVAKDKSRPFIVTSGDATVRAVGTQFDVYHRESGTTVTVLEGRVAVYSRAHGQDAMGSPEQTDSRSSPAPTSSPRNQPAGAAASIPTGSPSLTAPVGSGAVFLSAGEQVTVTADDIVTAPHHTDLATASAWTQKKLIFEASKLSDVVDEFNRYNHTQIVIEDPKLRNFEISGVYASPDPASLLRFLRDQGVKVTEADAEIRIGAP